MKILIPLIFIGYWFYAVQSGSQPHAYTVNKPVAPELVYFHNPLYPCTTYDASGKPVR